MDEALWPGEFSEPILCYAFGGVPASANDDGRCVQYRKFLTLSGPYIDHFVAEDDA